MTPYDAVYLSIRDLRRLDLYARIDFFCNRRRHITSIYPESQGLHLDRQKRVGVADERAQSMPGGDAPQLPRIDITLPSKIGAGMAVKSYSAQLFRCVLWPGALNLKYGKCSKDVPWS